MLTASGAKRRINAKRVFAPLVAAASLLIASHAAALPGDLDPGFGDAGLVISDLGEETSVRDIVLQPDGRIVMVGENPGPGGGFLVARYRANGTFDPTFSGGGWSFIEVPVERSESSSVALQGNKIIVGGVTQDPVDQRHLVLLRLTAGGALDPTFGGGDGIVKRTLNADPPGGAGVVDLVVQPNGRIVAVASYMDIYVVRFMPNGGLDTGFGTNGETEVSIADTQSVKAVALQNNGRIVVAGTAQDVSNDQDFLVARLLPGGDPDDSFDDDGIVVTPVSDTQGDVAEDVMIQSDGKIVAAGWVEDASDRDFAVVRYTSTGTPDNDFSGNGIVSFGDTDLSDYALAVARHTGGKILVGGTIQLDTLDSAAVLARLRPNGTLDNVFSGNGSLIEDFGLSNAAFISLAVTPNGSIIAGTALQDGSDQYLGLAKFRDRDASLLTLEISRRSTTVRLGGDLAPNKAGQKVTVSFFRGKSGGGFTRIGRKTLTLDGASRYSTSFGRPNAPRCRATVTYPGDQLNLPSTRTKTFTC